MTETQATSPTASTDAPEIVPVGQVPPLGVLPQKMTR